MKQLILLFLSLFSLFGCAHSQVPNALRLDGNYLEQLEKVDIAAIDTSFIYVGDQQSQDLFYYALVPQNSIRGTLILLPPTGQTVEQVIDHNVALMQLAFDHRVLVIVPSINFNLALDTTAIDFLNTTFAHFLSRYEAPKEKTIIGGFSLGGINALRYAEISREAPERTVLQPVAVYGVDPPLDFTRLYYSFVDAIKKNYSEPAIQEAKMYTKKMQYHFGGTPQEVPEPYIQHSVYSKSEKYGGNAQYLQELPVRIYSDPDINWHLENRKVDYYDLNALDQAAMINELHLMGNDQAEYVNALGKGYRMDGRRHPHSWSLVDPDECIQWMLKYLN